MGLWREKEEGDRIIERKGKMKGKKSVSRKGNGQKGHIDEENNEN